MTWKEAEARVTRIVQWGIGLAFIGVLIAVARLLWRLAAVWP